MVSSNVASDDDDFTTAFFELVDALGGVFFGAEETEAIEDAALDFTIGFVAFEEVPFVDCVPGFEEGLLPTLERLEAVADIFDDVRVCEESDVCSLALDTEDTGCIGAPLDSLEDEELVIIVELSDDADEEDTVSPITPDIGISCAMALMGQKRSVIATPAAKRRTSSLSWKESAFTVIYE